MIQILTVQLITFFYESQSPCLMIDAFLVEEGIHHHHSVILSCQIDELALS